jgi:hypothetical protein
MNVPNITPEEARAHVTSEHARIRTLVTDLVNESLQTACKVGHRTLRSRLNALRSAVERVIDIEERELVPRLHHADAWGPVRVERVRERHARLRAVLDDFEEEVTPERHETCDVVVRTEELVRAVSSDLDEEQQALVATEEAETAIIITAQEPE